MTKTEFGAIKKMTAQIDKSGQVNYQLPLGSELVALNPLIGKTLHLHFNGEIRCSNCDRKTKKSYSQGFCFPCMQRLAQCDMCIMKPETCHFHLGSCREPSWGETHCMTPHYVYLANSSGLKVGITRHTQIPTRWIDQGAIQALPIFKVKSRLISGLVETALTDFIADKTNWRAMLKGSPEVIDLKARATELKPLIAEKLADIVLNHGEDAVVSLDEEVVDIQYPVLAYLSKISSFNFDKTPTVGGTLQGIKGQYLIFDTGVINMRKFTSYQVSAEFSL